MSQTFFVWLVLAAALVAANLPFASHRFLLIRSLASGRKSLPLHLLELLVGYLAVGLLGMLLEQKVGQMATQGWEFYAITATLFLTFAFPGFVYRYLVRRR